MLQGLCTEVDLPQSDHLRRSLLLPIYSLPLRPHPVGEGEAGSPTTTFLDRNRHFLHQGSMDAETNIFIVKVFELLCIYADRFQSYIPLNFLIGFYVQQVPKLWSFPGHTTAKIDLKIYLRPMRIFLEILLITFFSSWVPP